MDRPARISLSGDLEGEYVVLACQSGGVLKIAPVAPGGRRTVTSLTKTCTAFPSQWEGALDDGRALYVRYRGGWLSVGLGENVNDAVDNSMSKERLFGEHVSHGLDGFMEIDELRAHLYGLLDFPEDLEVEGESGLQAMFGRGGGAEDEDGEEGEEDDR